MPTGKASGPRETLNKSESVRAEPAEVAQCFCGVRFDKPVLSVVEGLNANGLNQCFPRSCGGFTYVLLLFAVALSGVLLAAAGQLWHTNVQREKEADLLFAGREIRAAIESYYREPAPLATSGNAHEYPKQLEQLLEDRRNSKGLALSRRHLRRLYFDPVTASFEWGLIRQGEGIIGVYSLSRDKPLRTAGFAAGEEQFPEAKTYGDWRFIATPGEGGNAPSGSQEGAMPSQPAATNASSLKPK